MSCATRCKRAGPSLVGADHGMDILGDPVASVHALERVVAAYERFI